MKNFEVLGYLAAILTTSSFLPQLLRIIRTRHTKDISLWMYLVLVSGIILWIVYGYITRSWPVVGANIITLAIATAILVFKIRYK